MIFSLPITEKFLDLYKYLKENSLNCFEVVETVFLHTNKYETLLDFNIKKIRKITIKEETDITMLYNLGKHNVEELEILGNLPIGKLDMDDLFKNFYYLQKINISSNIQLLFIRFYIIHFTYFKDLKEIRLLSRNFFLDELDGLFNDYILYHNNLIVLQIDIVTKDNSYNEYNKKYQNYPGINIKYVSERVYKELENSNAKKNKLKREEIKLTIVKSEKLNSDNTSSQEEEIGGLFD